ncbi:MAG: EamA family transporter [Chloroflexi bacterium]|nr:MAG: EamA family transporter [Chloroflexota bacterium]
MDQSTRTNHPTTVSGTTGAGMAARATPLAIWLGLLTLYLVWGSTYLGIKIAVESIPAFVMGAARFLVAGGLLLLWSVARDGRDALRLTRRELRDSFLVGAALLGGGMGMVALGEQTVPSGITALLIALMPAWLAVLGRIVFGDRLPILVVVGIVVGLAGVAILVVPTDGRLALDPGGLAAVLLSPISWASGSLYASHRAQLPRRPLVAAAVQMLSGAVVLGVASLATGELASFQPASVTASAGGALLYLIVVGSIVGYTTYGWLLRVAPLPRIATYAYVNPVVAFILGAILLGEPISIRTVLAAVVIVVGVALIITARSRLQAGAAADAVATEVVPADLVAAGIAGARAAPVAPPHEAASARG